MSHEWKIPDFMQFVSQGIEDNWAKKKLLVLRSEKYHLNGRKFWKQASSYCTTRLCTSLKVALQILGWKFYKITEKIMLILPQANNFHS